MARVENSLYTFAKWLNWLAQGAIVIMMLLSVANIIAGYIRQPIFGTYELVSFLALVALSFSIPYCALQKGHVAVTFVTDLLPHTVQKILGILTGILGVGIFGIIGWSSAAYATKLWQKGEISGTLHLPLHPLVYGVSVGCSMLALVLLAELINLLRGSKEC